MNSHNYTLTEFVYIMLSMFFSFFNLKSAFLGYDHLVSAESSHTINTVYTTNQLTMSCSSLDPYVYLYTISIVFQALLCESHNQTNAAVETVLSPRSEL